MRDQVLHEIDRPPADEEERIELALLEQLGIDIGGVVARLHVRFGDVVGLEDRADRDAGAGAGRTQRDALALQVGDAGDPGPGRDEQMHVFGEEIGDDADRRLLAGLAERAGAGHRLVHHVALGEARLRAAGIDGEHIGHGAFGGPRADDQAGRAADRSRLAAVDAGRMAEQAGDELADRKISSPGRAGQDLERDARAEALGGAERDGEQQGTADRGETGGGEGKDPAQIHGQPNPTRLLRQDLDAFGEKQPSGGVRRNAIRPADPGLYVVMTQYA